MIVTGTRPTGLSRALASGGTAYTAITQLLNSGTVGPGDDILVQAPAVVMPHLGASYPISRFGTDPVRVKARTVWLALVRHGVLNMLNVPDNEVVILDHPGPTEADTSAFPLYEGEPLDFHEIRFMLDNGMLNPTDTVVIETDFRQTSSGAGGSMTDGIYLLANRLNGNVIGSNRIETTAEWVENRLILTDGIRGLTKSTESCRPRTTPGGGCTTTTRRMIEPIRVVEYPTSNIGRPGDGRPETPDRGDDGGANDRDQDQGGSGGPPDDPNKNDGDWQGASFAGIGVGAWSMILGGGALASVLYQRYNDE